MNLIVTLGLPKRDHVKYNEWSKYNECSLQIINEKTGILLKEDKYITPPDNIAHNGNIHFASGSFYKKKLFVPSCTEILVYKLPQLHIQKIYSHPTFNDIHHVTVHNDLIYICNTGLEIIQVMDLTGNILKEYNVGLGSTWERFSQDIDYRLEPTTKPHETHANFVFFLGEELWCTRFLQKDAICIGDSSKKIRLDISKGGPHDGLVLDDFIYFTLTDGYVVIVNKHTLKTEEIIDLNEISNYKVLLGWCRGIEVIDKKAYVGFSALRLSKYREYGLWIKYGKKPLASRIAVYNLDNKTLEKEIPIAKDTGAAIFTIKKLH